MNWKWLADFPSTNGRIFTSIVLSSAFVGVLLTAIVRGRALQIEAVWALAAFLLTMMGLDVAQYIQKRKTFIATTPPGGSDVEDAAAGATTQLPTPDQDKP